MARRSGDHVGHRPMTDLGDVGGEGIFTASWTSGYLPVITVPMKIVTDIGIAVFGASDVHHRASLVCTRSR